MITRALFRPSYLYPEYWGVWLIASFLWLLSYIPCFLQSIIGKYIGYVLFLLYPKRAHIVKRNLALCFPDITEDERRQLLHSNLKESGRALFDMGNAWYWSDKTVQENMEVSGAEHLKEAEEQNCGIILFATHSLVLEMGARVFGQVKPGIGVYRPHNNPLIEYLQVKARLVSNKALIPKSNPREIIKMLNAGEVIWYSSDQAPAKKSALFVPFFAQERVATTTAVVRLVKLGNARLCPLFVERKNNGKYRIEILAPLENFPDGCIETDVRRLNSILEKLILRRPEQYLWAHRRFKTQLESSAADVYNNHEL